MSLNKIKITDIRIENEIEKVVLYLNVDQYDYVVDKDNKVVRGTNKFKNNVDYIITLTRSINKTKNVDKCPNCGAGIDIVSGGVCPYCDSTIISKSGEFVMSKKECIGQRRK
jgi:DNA-directed RNA polymerase subunit RPC12/RpoP